VKKLNDVFENIVLFLQGGFFGLALPLILGILFTLGIPLVQVNIKFRKNIFFIRQTLIIIIFI